MSKMGTDASRMPLLSGQSSIGLEPIPILPNTQHPPSGNAVRSLHAPLIGPLDEAFSAHARCPVGVELSGVERPSCEQFLAGLDIPTCLHLVKIKPWNDCLLADFQLSILFPLIDRMLGGGDDDFTLPRRAPSDIELPLAARLTRTFLQQLRRTWANVAELEFVPLRAESNPRLLRAFPADELFLTVEFTLTLGGQRGMLRLGYPQRTFDRLREEAARGADNNVPEGESPREALVEVSVALPPLSLGVEELSALVNGDIIATDAEADAPVVVSLAGRPKFLGRLGGCGGRKAVLIGEPLVDAQ